MYFIKVPVLLCFSALIAASRENTVKDEPAVGKRLLLTPYIEEGQFELAKNLSRVGTLHGINVPSFSGFLTVNKTTDSNMFFWFFPAMENPETAPIFLWMQGGPGSSSMLGLFQEHGPYFVNQDLTLEFRNTTWIKQFSIIYIDNPVGTGFSFTKEDAGYSTEISQIGDNLFEAMQQFFTLFSEYSTNDFYVTGESMAGKFVPAAAYAIHKNKDIAKMKLTGITIGDGLCDPETMMDYGDFLLSIGLIDEGQADHFREEERKIKDLLAQDKKLDAYLIWAQLIDSEKVNKPITYFTNSTGFTYKFNLLSAKDPAAPRAYNKFLKLNQTRRAIHVGHQTFSDGVEVHKHLWGSIMTSVKPLVAELIEHYKVLISNGQLDIIVPYPLTRAFVNSIPWSGANELSNGKRIIWKDKKTGQPAGYVRQSGNFTEVLVRNAGHLMPYDQPEYAYDMMDRFINNKPFN